MAGGAQFTVPTTVLVVDDEPMITTILARTLGPGYTVSAAQSCEEALGILRSGAQFDALICDLIMPGHSGIELYRQLEEDFPDQAARVIFMTGGAYAADARGFLQNFVGRYVEKPFDLDELRSMIASVAPPHPG